MSHHRRNPTFLDMPEMEVFQEPKPTLSDEDLQMIDQAALNMLNEFKTLHPSIRGLVMRAVMDKFEQYLKQDAMT